MYTLRVHEPLAMCKRPRMYTVIRKYVRVEGIFLFFFHSLSFLSLSSSLSFFCVNLLIKSRCDSSDDWNPVDIMCIFF